MIALASLALLAVAFAAWVYVASERHLLSFARPPEFDVAIPSDAASIARGDHLIRTRGCRGCHGNSLEGKLMWEFAVAPNLARLARERSAADIEAALRHGIAHDGRAMYSMPSFGFLRLRDADVADMIAYLRSIPVVRADLPSPSLPWNVRFDIARGADKAIPGFLSLVPPLAHARHPDERIARGEYLAMTTCNECHGFSLRSDSPFGDAAPDLIVVAGYDEASFERLMHAGKAIGDRELPRMSRVARNRFATLTDQEVRDLFAFLSDMAAKAAAER
jgi:mono/diheme cytochrome c family protein